MRKLKIMRNAAAALMFFVASFSFAEISMPKIFSDGMVLQREMPVKIWGKATPGARVGLEFAGQKKMTKAGKDGAWNIVLNPLKTDKKPSEMLLFENGKEAKKIGDILVGEVWVLGGQSNMEWRTKNTTDFKDVEKRADYPLIRYFFMTPGVIAETKQFDCPDKSRWEPILPSNVGNTSGVGFYFAEKLLKDLGGEVPVGLIDTPLGGSSMCAWIPDEDITGIEYLESNLKKFKEAKEKYVYADAIKAWRERYDAWQKQADEAKAAKKPIPQKPFNVRNKPLEMTPWRMQNSPAYLFNAKIAPIAGYAARGALWYQGESDAAGKSLEAFKPQFTRLIDTWRKYWGQGDDFYFAWVQLASFTTKANWPEARWQQYLTLKEVPKTGMANIIDCGEEKDIHPKDKATVGTRLENIIMRDVYGKKNPVYYGPIFKMVRYTPKGAEVVFDLDGRSLVGKGDPRGFEVKIGGEWKKANAELVGKRVIVNPVEKVKGEQIEGVRYLWENWALPNVWLFNDKGLPALSFIHEK